MSLRQCKTRNFCAHFAETNMALVQKVKKKENSCFKTIFKGSFRKPIQNCIECTKKNTKLDSVFEIEKKIIDGRSILHAGDLGILNPFVLKPFILYNQSFKK